MKTLDEIKTILVHEKPYLAARYGVTELGLFGSYVRGEQKQESDIDLLIELERPPKISLLDLVELEQYLTDQLDTKVDIALRTNLRPRIRQIILQEVVPL